MSEQEIASLGNDAAEEIEQETAEEASAATADEESGAERGDEADSEDTESEQPEKKSRSGYQRVKRQLQRAEQEREFWRQEALRGRPEQGKQQQEPVKPQVLEAPKKPKLEDFKTYEEYDAAKDEYVEKLTDYKAAKAAADLEARQRQQEQARQIKSEMDAAREKFEDFNEVAGPTLQEILAPNSGIPESVKEAIGTSDVFAELLYVMGSDAEEAKDLLDTARRNPTAAIKQIGHLEHLIREERAALKAKPAKEKESEDEEEAESPTPVRSQVTKSAVSRAPEPIKPVTKGGKGTVDLNDPKLPYKDWLKAREAQIKRAN